MDPGARARAADALAAGEIIVIPFNGIFVLVGNADDASVPEKIAVAKQRPRAKGVALVCPPELLAEYIALEELEPFERTLAQVQALYLALHSVGVILPAAGSRAPRHVVQATTILNVWTEQRPMSPLRELVLELRQRGLRALAGTSANQSGWPTITDPGEVTSVFAHRVPMILLDNFDTVAPARRHSATIVDLTWARPRLVREGSVRAAELRTELLRQDLGDLEVPPNVPRV
jgi:tRNA A37 threonylcarbamoyladenosine synthetase subunit TsaC/SUA5/YrdC